MGFAPCKAQKPLQGMKLIPGMGVWSQYMELIMHGGMGSVQVNNSLDIDSWHPKGDTHLNNPSAESTRLKYV